MGKLKCQLLLVLLGAQLFAAKPILEWEHRPTIKEVMEEVNNIEVSQPSEPLHNGQHFQFSHWTKIMRVHSPQLIAALEKTYPGATFAFIGRDSQLIGDIVEGFYMSIGQLNRVVRIGSSKGSWEKPPEDGMVLKYLEKRRFSLDRVKEAHPYVLIDTMSKGYGRQARAFLGAVYRSYAERGGNLQDLVKKFNIMGLLVSTFQGQPMPFEDIDAIRKVAVDLFSHGLPGGFESMFVFPTFNDPGDKFNEIGYDHHTGAWHSSFGPFVTTMDGVDTQRGPATDKETREAVLWTQLQVLRMTHDPEFKVAVEQAAQRLQFTFPQKRPEAEILDPPQIEAEEVATFEAVEEEEAIEVPDEIRELLQSMSETDATLRKEKLLSGHKAAMDSLFRKMTKKVESQPFELTENGKAFLEFFEEALKSHYSNDFLGLLLVRAARQGRDGLRFRSHDLRKMMKKAFAIGRISTEMLREVLAFMDEAKAFRDMMTNAKWIEEKSGHENYQKMQLLVDYFSKCSRRMMLLDD